MVSINLDFKAHNHLNIHPQGLMSLSLSSHLGTVHIPCFLSPLVLQHTTTTQIQMSLSSTTPFSHSLQLIHPHTHLSSLPASSSSSIIVSPLQISRHRHKASRFTINASSTPPPTTTTKPTQSFRTKSPKDVNVLVTGSTGYIGKFVVRELCRRGFNVIAVSRERSGVRGRDDKARAAQKLAGSTVCFADVTDPDSLGRALEPLPRPVDAVVCCLASRGGGISDSWKVDYGASRNSLLAGRRLGASHFVLLSAICVQKPLLAFQRAKLKFEGELAEEAARDPGFTYSIVRPTAFFKSLGGQVETVKDGKPYVMFGDGRLCACKPISEADLASFIVDCVLDEDKACKVLPIGGPGKALTPLEQGELLFKLLGRESKFLKVPIEVMDFVIGVLDFLAKVFPSLEDAAEFGKIGRYYAAESMLALDPETGEYSAEKTPSYGKDTLEEFFARVIREGMAGQELGEQTIF